MTGTDYTERFERLLELFPHPERRAAPTPQQRAWRMVEIERDTGGEVSSSWLSAFRRRKTKKPGMRMLDLIAQAMGFPFELWLTEPEQWERILRERGSYAAEGHAAAGYSAGGVEPVGAVAYGSGEVPPVSELLETLIATITNRRTGRPFTNSEIAERSSGRLTEEDVADMHSGELENPLRSQLLALCDVFGVELSYWYGGSAYPSVSAEDLQRLHQARHSSSKLLLQKSLDLDEEQVNLLVSMAEHMRSRSRD